MVVRAPQSRFDGYKLSAAVTNSSEPLIMTVHVAPGGESDGPQAKHLIDQQPAEHRPDRILGDTAYGNGVVRSELAERDVQVLAPVPEGTVLEDRVAKRDFTIDPAAGTVTCPAGNTATITTSKTGVRTARIPRAVCARLSVEGPVLPRSTEPADRARRARRVDDRGPPSAQRSRDRRSPPAYPAQDRAAPRAARSPLRGAQEPVHRQRQSPAASQLGRRAGQPQPNWPTPRYRSSMTAGNAAYRASSPSKDHGRLIAAPTARGRSGR